MAVVINIGQVAEVTPPPVLMPVGGWYETEKDRRAKHYIGVLHPWFIGHTEVGDASGGAVTIHFSFRAATGNNRLFVAITEFKFQTTDTSGGAVSLNMAALTDYPERSLQAIGPGIVVDSTTAGLNQEFVTVGIPEQLGQVLVGTNGRLSTVFAANVDTKAYRIQARGWYSDRPFNVPRTLIP